MKRSVDQSYNLITSIPWDASEATLDFTSTKKRKKKEMGVDYRTLFPI